MGLREQKGGRGIFLWIWLANKDQSCECEKIVIAAEINLLPAFESPNAVVVGYSC
jgi:hypothetical protein